MTPSNGTTSARRVWWILGIFGTLLFVGLALILNKLDRLDMRTNSNDLALARLHEQLRQVDSLVTMTRAEQVDRTQRFGDMTNRLNLIEQTIRGKQSSGDIFRWP